MSRLPEINTEPLQTSFNPWMLQGEGTGNEALNLGAEALSRSDISLETGNKDGDPGENTLTVAAMDPNWAHSVADTIYSFHDHSQQELQQLLLGVNTFNELLHLTHSYVMNDDSLRDSLEVWSDSSPGHRIRGLGTKNKATEEIHQAFLTAWGLGNEYEKEGWRQRPPHTVDIVLAGSTLHIIVRDRGHALSLVVNNLTRYQEGEVLVQYNIPKVLNKDMVRQLPGISTVKPGYASGQWTCHISDLANKIMSFVKQVPTDFDNPNIQALFAQKQPS